MTFREAYIYAYAVLDSLWENNPNPDLGAILGEMNLWHPLGNDSKPADPALLHDWLNAITKVTSTDSLSDTQAILAAYYLLKEFNDNQRFNFTEEIAILKQKYDRSIEVKKTWKRNRE
jgi:hypothetical protein